MNINPFKAVFPKVDLIPSPNSFFASIKYQYREYRASGVYSPTFDDAYYIYQINSQFGSHTGIVCGTAVDDFHNKKILPHERTLAMKEQQMMHLLLKRKALVKPVLLGYYPKDDLHKKLMNSIENIEPNIHVIFENNEEEHKIWVVKDENFMQEIHDSFSKLDAAYIGDGHHRTTTVSLLNTSKDLGEDAKKYKSLLTAYFPFEQLNILDFNRVVDISEIMSSSRFVAHLSKYFSIRPLKKARKPKQKHELTMLIDGYWYTLKWKNKFTSQKTDSGILLDSDLINKFIFEGILKIKDIRTDTRIKYFGGTEPMDKIIRQTKKFKNGVGFCISPVAIEELTTVADHHMTLPPKSTWFEPRLRSGIIAKDL